MRKINERNGGEHRGSGKRDCGKDDELAEERPTCEALEQQVSRLCAVEVPENSKQMRSPLARLFSFVGNNAALYALSARGTSFFEFVRNSMLFWYLALSRAFL